MFPFVFTLTPICNNGSFGFHNGTKLNISVEFDPQFNLIYSISAICYFKHTSDLNVMKF